MDDLTKKRFDQLDAKIDGVEGRLGAALDASLGASLEKAVGRLEDGLARSAAGLRSALEDQIARNHREQIGRFQTVIEKADNLGRQLGKLEERAEGERDRRIERLETEMANVRELLLKLTGGGVRS